MAFKPDGSEVYLLDTAFRQVAVIAVGAGNVLTDTGVRIPVGPAENYFGVDQMAVDRTGERLLVNCADGKIYAIDLTNRMVVDTLPSSNLSGGGIVFQR